VGDYKTTNNFNMHYWLLLLIRIWQFLLFGCSINAWINRIKVICSLAFTLFWLSLYKQKKIPRTWRGTFTS